MGLADAKAWSEALTFHHQWMVLSREHALALVAHKLTLIKVGEKSEEEV